MGKRSLTQGLFVISVGGSSGCLCPGFSHPTPSTHARRAKESYEEFRRQQANEAFSKVLKASLHLRVPRAYAPGNGLVVV